MTKEERSETEDDLLLTLPTDCEIHVTRTFDAPPGRVFEAWTRPEHLRQWWGCESQEMIVCEVDLRVGGNWRHVLRWPDGREDTFNGVFREIVEERRLVYTKVQENAPGTEHVVTVTFEDRDGRTLMTERSVFESRTSRDQYLRLGIEDGMSDLYRRLDEMLTVMADPR